jgi:predicted amidophosphoribosyltransferase
MAAFCSCCGAEIKLKAEVCAVCGAPRHGMMPSKWEPAGAPAEDQKQQDQAGKPRRQRL